MAYKPKGTKDLGFKDVPNMQVTVAMSNPIGKKG